MRRMLFVGLVLVKLTPLGAAEGAAGQGAIEIRTRSQDAWSPLLYQLPGAYRLLDRLDLTEEQRKALAKIYNDWATERRDAYREIATKLPQLSAEDRKDPEKLKAYMTRYTEIYKAAHVTPPIELVEDVLSDVQLAKIQEATRIMEEWEHWLAGHMAQYTKALDQLLGPVPVPEAEGAGQHFILRTYESLVRGGELFSRLSLSSAQIEELKALWGRYRTEYSSMLTPLSQQPREDAISIRQQMEVRHIIATKAQETIRDKYGKLAMQILTPPQRELFTKALALIEERDRALWERYERYVLDLSAVLPSPSVGSTQSP